MKLIHAVNSSHFKLNSMSNNKHEKKCTNCARPHDIGGCTARNKTCHKCKKTGHFEKCVIKKIGDSFFTSHLVLFRTEQTFIPAIQP